MVAMGVVGGAMGQHMDVGVAVPAAFLHHVLEVRVLQDGQPAAVLLALAVLAEAVVEAALQIVGGQKGPDGIQHGGAVGREGDAVGDVGIGVGGDEEDARLLQPAEAARRQIARAPRDHHRHPGLQGQPALGPAGRADRHLGQLEGQRGQLRGRQHQAQMHEGVTAARVAGQRAGQAGYRAQHLGHLDAHGAQLGQLFLGVGAGAIAHRIHAPHKGVVLEGQGHDAGLGLVADAQIQGQRRQQLVVRRARAQQLDGHGADLDLIAHGGS